MLPRESQKKNMRLRPQFRLSTSLILECFPAAAAGSASRAFLTRCRSRRINLINFTWLAFNVHSGKRDHPIPASDRNQRAFGVLSVLLQRNRFGSDGYTMMMDFHNLQLPFLCQLSKSTPNILWRVGSSVHNQFLQVGRGNPAVIAAKISLKSFLDRPARKMPAAARIRAASSTKDSPRKRGSRPTRTRCGR